jgi:hypothetical protein
MRVMGNQNNTANVPATVNPKDLKGDSVCEPESGKVRGTVWKNFSQRSGKHYYKVSIRRVEHDADGKSYLANSFWPEDMKDVASVASQCRIWLQDNTDAYEQQREWRKEKMKRSKKPKASTTAESPDSGE